LVALEIRTANRVIPAVIILTLIVNMIMLSEERVAPTFFQPSKENIPMLKFIKAIFANKQLISDSTFIKSGYSHGRADGSSSGQWYKT
jgi:hypothetical protein